MQGHLGRTLALADREGYRADADCLLALAYAEVCAGRFDTALELAAAATQHGFNATAHYVLYRAVLDHALRRHLDETEFRAAVERGLRLSASEALAAQGIARG